MRPTDPSDPSDSSADEPDFSDFLAPVEPRKSRRALISVIAALTVLVMVSAAVASVLVWTSRDGSTGGASSSAQMSWEPASQSTVAKITIATERYVAAVNAGIADDYLATLCGPIREQLAGITDTEAADPPMVVRAVTEVMVDGDIATATVSISAEGKTEASPRSDTLRFLDDGGWKYCGRFQ